MSRPLSIYSMTMALFNRIVFEVLVAAGGGFDGGVDEFESQSKKDEFVLGLLGMSLKRAGVWRRAARKGEPVRLREETCQKIREQIGEVFDKIKHLGISPVRNDVAAPAISDVFQKRVNVPYNRAERERCRLSYIARTMTEQRIQEIKQQLAALTGEAEIGVANIAMAFGIRPECVRRWIERLEGAGEKRTVVKMESYKHYLAYCKIKNSENKEWEKRSPGVSEVVESLVISEVVKSSLVPEAVASPIVSDTNHAAPLVIDSSLGEDELEDIVFQAREALLVKEMERIQEKFDTETKKVIVRLEALRLDHCRDIKNNVVPKLP